MTPHATEACPGWSDAQLLGCGAKDGEHRDFVATRQAVGADGVSARLEDFSAPARRHFAAEDAWMRETNFPPRQCHFDERATVLQSLNEVRALVAQGRVDRVPSLAAALGRLPCSAALRRGPDPDPAPGL